MRTRQHSSWPTSLHCNMVNKYLYILMSRERELLIPVFLTRLLIAFSYTPLHGGDQITKPPRGKDMNIKTPLIRKSGSKMAEFE
uniref:Uncharacterized protein n=1 Tax=Nelumbo nucifera TaxID=4432 RepID=A0A822XEH9_NELNU|nr:TPA_asm: hypothetical protein HUJ06_020193 [Nelumbo nucifera]